MNTILQQFSSFVMPFTGHGSFGINRQASKGRSKGTQLFGILYYDCPALTPPRVEQASQPGFLDLEHGGKAFGEASSDKY